MRRIAVLGVLAACGRSGIVTDGGFDEGPLVGDDGDLDPEADEPGAEDSGPKPAPDDPDAPPPVNPMPDGCGDGVIEQGELCFAPHVAFASRIDPCAIDIADLDGDGHLDAAVPNSDFLHEESPDNFASVLYGDGKGGLGQPAPFLAGGDFAVGITIGDVDLDARLDLVVTSDTVGHVNVLLAVAPRAYAAPIANGGSLGPSTSALGDLDGDGVLDLAIADSGSAAVLVARGRGDGTFDPPVAYPGPIGPWVVGMVDIDGDGALDVHVTDFSSDEVYIWRGDGTGAFGDPRQVRTSFYPSHAALADIDADGDLDMLVATDTVTNVRFNGPGMSFSDGDDIVAGAQPYDVAIADLDADGRLDAAILAKFSNDVTVAIGDGAGGFEPAAIYPVGNNPSGIRAGDFNEDGVPDMAVSNQDDDSVGLIVSNP